MNALQSRWSPTERRDAAVLDLKVANDITGGKYHGRPGSAKKKIGSSEALGKIGDRILKLHK